MDAVVEDILQVTLKQLYGMLFLYVFPHLISFLLPGLSSSVSQSRRTWKKVRSIHPVPNFRKTCGFSIHEYEK